MPPRFLVLKATSKTLFASNHAARLGCDPTLKLHPRSQRRRRGGAELQHAGAAYTSRGIRCKRHRPRSAGAWLMPPRVDKPALSHVVRKECAVRTVTPRQQFTVTIAFGLELRSGSKADTRIRGCCAFVVNSVFRVRHDRGRQNYVYNVKKKKVKSERLFVRTMPSVLMYSFSPEKPQIKKMKKNIAVRH